MSRQSNDQHDSAGDLVNGFDYTLQAWVCSYIIQACGHPATMACGCNARRFAGYMVREARAIIEREQALANVIPTHGNARHDEHVTMAGDAFTYRNASGLHSGSFERAERCATCGEDMAPSNRPGWRHVTGYNGAHCTMVRK